MKKNPVKMRKILSRENLGITASVIQRSDLKLHTFTTDYPAIILLRRGKKTIHIGPKKIVLKVGDAIALAPGTTCDVLNETDQGQFESTWIVFSDPIVEKAYQSYSNLKKLPEVVGLKNLGAEFIDSFDRGVRSISEPGSIPDVVAEIRLQEILGWLTQTGYIFYPDYSEGLIRKLRLLIGSDLQHKWISKDVASSLAMSEATLRRKLSSLGHSFNDMLIDVRMTSAITMLQVTDTPISEIAYKVGYESASRFSARFKKRFGFSPNAVRGNS